MTIAHIIALYLILPIDAFLSAIGLNLNDLTGGNIDPQQMIKLSKKGKPVMIFIGVRGQPDRARTEKVSSLWAQSLQNAQLQVIPSV